MIYMDEEVHLTDLISVETLQKIQDSFSKMARMAAHTTDENGKPVTEGSNFSEFCTNYCRKSPIGRERCEKCDRDGALKVLDSGNPDTTRGAYGIRAILRCLSRTASQYYVVLFCFFKAQLCSHRQDYKSQHHYSSHTEQLYMMPKHLIMCT